MKKQYFNNSKPGEKTIESRDGSKVVLDSNGNVILTTALDTEYSDLLTINGYQDNINPNPDKDASYFFVGTNQIDLNNQGNKNQDSINIKSDNVITPDIKTNLDEIIIPSQYETPVEPVETFPFRDQQSSTLPDDELAYINSSWYNDFGDQGQGSGFEGTMTNEEIKKMNDFFSNIDYSNVKY